MAGHSSTEQDPGLTLTTQQPVAQQRIVDLLQAAWAVFVKDLRIELRTRYAINAMVLFAACTAMMVSIGTTFIGLRRTEEALLIQASLLWIALLFAAISGLSRGFVHEEETRTLAALRLAAPAIAVYLGKFLLNLALLALLGLITSLLFIVLVRVQVGSPLAFLGMLAAGGLSLATSTTILAAIITRASFKNALFAVLAFPLLVPPLIIAIQGTAATLADGGGVVALPALQFLIAYSVAMFVASLLLFRFVWEA
ncbi:heme exporter protein CcmB [Candidatus Chloroploca asiatica]|uniref:heme exporter protein CcmB n=1 Tax=Candidatus Chloroploca asiatica TaxID=1506545 RepID=UPI000BE8B54C|nr:heme exporter protein CcmB [Candidatus Chloroploca asiatica]